MRRLMAAALAKVTPNFRATVPGRGLSPRPTTIRNWAMPPIRAVVDDPRELSIDPLELIFSCGVCQATLSEIYSEPGSNIGLRESADPRIGPINKFWLTTCAHLTCGEHLEGGGAPVHGYDQEVPTAPCPVCSAEKNDHSVKNLYYIRGLKDGEHHKHIPKSWFETPSAIRDETDPGMDGIRFQYLSLIHTGSELKAKLVRVEEELAGLQAHDDDSAHALKTLRADKLFLEGKVAELENRLQAWKVRQPRILHNMQVFRTVIEELQAARQRLLHLGGDVSSIDFTLQLAEHPPNGQDYGTPCEDSNRTSNGGTGTDPRVLRSDSRSVHRGTEDGEAFRSRHGSSAAYASLMPAGRSQLPIPIHQHRNQSPIKRKRAESVSELEHDGGHIQSRALDHRGASRDMMPPPALPLPSVGRSPRFHSYDGIQAYNTPNLRRNISPTLRVPGDDLVYDQRSNYAVERHAGAANIDGHDPHSVSPRLRSPGPIPPDYSQPNRQRPDWTGPDNTAPLVEATSFGGRRERPILGFRAPLHREQPKWDAGDRTPSYESLNSLGSGHWTPHSQRSSPVGHMFGPMEMPQASPLREAEHAFPAAHAEHWPPESFPFNDGELDQSLSRPPRPPQQPSRRHPDNSNNNNISPTRNRIPLLPPTTPLRVATALPMGPRMTTTYPPPLVRPTSTTIRPHREPLGQQVVTNITSPFFGSRARTATEGNYSSWAAPATPHELHSGGNYGTRSSTSTLHGSRNAGTDGGRRRAHR